VVPERDDAAVWDVVCPARPSRVAGVSMARFRDRGMTAVEQRAIPHPAVTLALEFGAGPLIVEDAAGRQQRGSLVAGLGVRTRRGLGAGRALRGRAGAPVPAGRPRFWASPRPTWTALSWPWTTCGADRRHASVSN
jgi:hypothetical protein